MKIIYRDEKDLSYLKSLTKESGYTIEYQQKVSFAEIKEALKKYKGPPIGAPLPDGLIDIGTHLYGFILSDEFPKAVAEKVLIYSIFDTIVKPFYKKIFKKKDKNTQDKKSIFIISDEYGVNDSQYSIYFVIYDELNDAQIENALKTLPKVREKILNLLKITSFSGSKTIRVTYINDKWYIQRFDLSYSSSNTDQETIKKINVYYNKRKDGQNRLKSLYLQIRQWFTMRHIPNSYIIPNPYNISIHNQGNKNNCTSHAFASMMEYYLSNKLKEKVAVDVNDLWEKQKKFGTATEESGDSLEGPFIISAKYGVKFSTENGKRGTCFTDINTEKVEGITHIPVSRIEFN